METTFKLALTLAYQDMESRTYTLSGVTNYPNVIKTKVRALNANMPEAFRRTFVSNFGAQCTSIAKAKFITVEEEEIYHAS